MPVAEPRDFQRGSKGWPEWVSLVGAFNWVSSPAETLVLVPFGTRLLRRFEKFKDQFDTAAPFSSMTPIICSRSSLISYSSPLDARVLHQGQGVPFQYFAGAFRLVGHEVKLRFPRLLWAKGNPGGWSRAALHKTMVFIPHCLCRISINPGLLASTVVACIGVTILGRWQSSVRHPQGVGTAGTFRACAVCRHSVVQGA